MDVRLEVKNLSCGYGGKPIVSDASFLLKKGEVLSLFGPNGAGKTTLFKTILGLIPWLGGEITLNGRPWEQFSRSERARYIAYVPQSRQTAFPYSVKEVVMMGRVGLRGRFSAPGKSDRTAVSRALETLGIGELENSLYTRLSGGEQQTVLLARALAQDTDFLVMDEPLSHLDYGRQYDFLRRISRLAERGKGILFTTHSPNHVLYCAHRALLMKEGRLVARGRAEEVITPENLKLLYGMDTTIREGTESTPSCCLPLGKENIGDVDDE